MSSLFVGNLSSRVRHRELENVFRRFGRSNLELKDGFGFVVYEEHRDAKRALESLQGKLVCGEQPSISWARKRRPFQRYSGKINSAMREKYQTRRRPSLETDRGTDDGRRDEKFVDEVKDGSRASEIREDAARSTGREAEWKETGPEKLGFDEEIKDLDPLDSGRWDPRMEDSPENVMVNGLMEDEENPLDDRDKEDERGSVHEKSPGSPGDRHFERSSRGYRNSSEQHRRGREAFIGRPQERCFNCGQSGHVKWQCRSRPRRINMHSRDGVYDGRRNDSRYFSGRGGFRGTGGGRFRGMNGSRRMLTRDTDAGYARRGSRRHEMAGDRRHYDPIDNKNREKNRRRRHRSESPKDSSSRGRSKRKHKSSSKKSTSSSKKRRRSSSGSPSSSQSPRSSSSSPSGSRSRSAASRSQSSRSGSHSSSSGSSRSRSSQSLSSRSRSSSASSLSRSRSVSSRSRKSPSKSLSLSPRSRGRSPPSPKAKRTHSPCSVSPRRSRSSTNEEDREVATSHRSEMQEKQAHEKAINVETEERDELKYSSDSHDMDQQDAKRRERRRVWSREAKKQKSKDRSDSEEPHPDAEPRSNGVKHAAKNIKADEAQVSVQQAGTTNESLTRDSVSFKASEPISHSQMSDTKCSMYVAIMKEGSKGGRHDGSQEWATASFGAARLWPWEAMLYRRVKRGPISTANYEKRKAQNEEFGITDTFVRSSSGWWEKPEE
eukprot:c24053_g1_i2 orf=450-2603(+)